MMLRTGNKGFTLVEIMVTTVILSFGTVIIQQGLLRSADLLGHFRRTLAVERWSGAELWRAREALLIEDPEGMGGRSGSFSEGGKNFNWALEASPISGDNDLFRLMLTVTWDEGNRPVKWTKVLYAGK